VKNLASSFSSLARDTAFVLLTRPAPNANAILTWRPGQREMTGISPDGSDGSRMSGCFVMFVPREEGDEARPFEDGYSLLLSSEPWALLLAAFAEQRRLSLSLGGGTEFELEWQ
jgi:hypothetical protein